MLNVVVDSQETDYLKKIINNWCSEYKGKRKANTNEKPDKEKQKKTVLAQIIEIARQSDHHVLCVFETLFQKLRSNNSRIRLQTLTIIESLFKRSSQFRLHVTKNFKEFILLCVSRKSKQLPKPADAAKSLEIKGLELIDSWNIKYPTEYPPIQLGYHYLSSCGKRFPSQFQEELQRQKQHEEEREKNIALLKYSKLVQDLANILPDIRANLEEMAACFDILIPRLDIGDNESKNENENIEAYIDEKVNFDENDDSEIEWEDVPGREVHHSTSENLDINDIVMEHGLGSSSYKLEISVPTTGVMKRKDNEALFDRVVDGSFLITKHHIPLIEELSESLKHLAEDEVDPDRQRWRSITMQLKQELYDTRDKSSELLGEVQPKNPTKRLSGAIPISEYKHPLRKRKPTITKIKNPNRIKKN